MKKCRGSMTITMCLIFSILLSLLLSGIQLAQTQAGRIQAMHAADTGIYSIFAQYDKDLLDSYDLFYLDAGYGSSQVNPSFIVRQMESFMKPTLETSLTRCQIQSCAITGYVLSTDENARSFMGQVSRAVKNQLGTQAISSLRDFLEQTDSTLKNQEEQKEQGLPDMEFDVTEAEEHPPAFTETNNPIAILKRLRELGILGLVLPSDRQVSQKEISLTDTLSHRTLQKGMGTLQSQNSDSGKLLMQAYVMNKLGNYSTEKDGHALSYEAEYIIGGRASDEENLKATVHRLIAIREAANCVYLYTDPQKREEAAMTAAALCSLLLIPEGMAIAEALIIAGWAYAESLLDVRQLMLGGSVPAIKSAESWQLNLSQIGQIFTLLQSDTIRSHSGLNYQNYLHLLLYSSSEQTQAFRCMDMIEQNIRTLPERSSFCMDSCMESLETETIFTGPQQKTWSAVRTYGYDM